MGASKFEDRLDTFFEGLDPELVAHIQVSGIGGRFNEGMSHLVASELIENPDALAVTWDDYAITRAGFVNRLKTLIGVDVSIERAKQSLQVLFIESYTYTPGLTRMLGYIDFYGDIINEMMPGPNVSIAASARAAVDLLSELDLTQDEAFWNAFIQDRPAKADEIHRVRMCFL